MLLPSAASSLVLFTIGLKKRQNDLVSVNKLESKNTTVRGSVFPHVLFDHTQRFKRDHNLMVFAIQTVFCHDTSVSINSKVHLLLDVFIISNENR